jgi:hypothetical protein
MTPSRKLSPLKWLGLVFAITVPFAGCVDLDDAPTACSSDPSLCLTEDSGNQDGESFHDARADSLSDIEGALDGDSRSDVVVSCDGECAPGTTESTNVGCASPKLTHRRTCSSTCSWVFDTDCAWPSGWSEMAIPSFLAGREALTATWTGKEMVVWGGDQFSSATRTSDGAAYNRSTDVWRKLATSPLTARHEHAALWSGKLVIVWGGHSDAAYNATGATYDPVADAWGGMAVSPLSARGGMFYVWSSSTNEAIFWGGRSDATPGRFADGAAYDPKANTWRVLSASPLAARSDGGAVWDGKRMVVFGGQGSGCPAGVCSDGAAYDPVANSWTTIPAPLAGVSGRLQFGFGALATGATRSQATFFGGVAGDFSTMTGNGMALDAAGASWMKIPAPDATILAKPSRSGSAVWWSGSRLWSWGGTDGSVGGLASGASYDAASGAWTAMPVVTGFSGRFFAAAIWTGTEAIIWGGTDKTSDFNDGRIFRPLVP